MNTIDKHRLSTLLRNKRRDLNLKLRHVAQQTGLSPSTLSRIENGHSHTMQLDNFLQICDWLGVSARSLIVQNGELEALPEAGPLERIETMLRSCSEEPELCRAIAEVISLIRSRR